MRDDAVVDGIHCEIGARMSRRQSHTGFGHIVYIGRLEFYMCVNLIHLMLKDYCPKSM